MQQFCKINKRIKIKLDLNDTPVPNVRWNGIEQFFKILNVFNYHIQPHAHARKYSHTLPSINQCVSPKYRRQEMHAEKQKIWTHLKCSKLNINFNWLIKWRFLFGKQIENRNFILSDKQTHWMVSHINHRRLNHVSKQNVFLIRLNSIKLIRSK